MGEITGITWTNKTHNFWYGCKKISAGCKFCYAERDMKRFGKNFKVITRSKGFDKPLKWKDPAMVFTCSWSDFFIEEADEWRDEAWEIIRRTPHLIYQILTKRPENILSRLPRDWGEGWDNVWLGVSIESQEFVHRVISLNNIHSRIRFVSAEPLLSEINLRPHLSIRLFGTKFIQRGIDWVIVGGESGSNYRPMNIKWLVDLAHQCNNSPAKLFIKQASGIRPGTQGDIPDDLWAIKEFPNGLRKKGEAHANI